MMSYQYIEMAALMHRERERALMHEAEIDRWLHEGTRRVPVGKQFAALLGTQLVMMGCWLQRRAGVREVAA